MVEEFTPAPSRFPWIALSAALLAGGAIFLSPAAGALIALAAACILALQGRIAEAGRVTQAPIHRPLGDGGSFPGATPEYPETALRTPSVLDGGTSRGR